MSRSRARPRGPHQQPRRVREQILRARRLVDERLEAERRAQHEFARAQMQLEAEADLYLPQMLGEPEPLL